MLWMISTNCTCALWRLPVIQKVNPIATGLFSYSFSSLTTLHPSVPEGFRKSLLAVLILENSNETYLGVYVMLSERVNDQVWN